jgi:putative ABC transport system permease protein
MSNWQSRPPRLAQWLLTHGLPADLREPIRGDLDEEFLAFQLSNGPVRARGWYWSQAVRTMVSAYVPEPARTGRRRNPMRHVSHDLRHGFRVLRTQRSFSLIAIATLAIGIGLSTTLFTVVHAAWIRPLPFPNPEQLVRADVVVRGGTRENRLSPSVEDVRAWRRSGRAATHGAVDRGPRPLVVEAGAPERISVSSVSEGYFETFGLAPAAGRTFRDADVSPSQPLTVMLGHRYWRTRFNGDPTAVGRSIRVDNKTAEIVGVAPAGFQPDVAVWRPFQSVPESFRGSGASIILRLRAGVTLEAAQAALAADLRGAGNANVAGVRLTSLYEETVEGARSTLKTLLAAVGSILLLACVNVAGLLLARGANRHRELAVRASLGGSRVQLARMLLAESVVLGLAGGAAGVMLAWLTLDGLVALLPLGIPATATVALNAPVLMFALIASLATAIVFGTVPALRLSKVRLTDALTRGDRRAGGSLTRRGGQMLIAIEVALAVMLVAGAGLMVRSFVRLAAVDLGFDADAFIALQVTPVDPRPAVSAAYYPALIEALRALPDVASVGAGNQLPLGGSRRAGSVAFPGRESIRVDVRVMTPGYFETLGIPVRLGHLPSAADTSRPVVVLNETAAERIFPGESPLGKQVPFESFGAEAVRPFEVVAVVSDTLQDGAKAPKRANVYTLYQGTESFGQAPLVVFVRPRGAVTGLGARLRATAESIGPPVIVDRVRPGAEFVSENIAIPRRRMQLLGLLGGVGLALALVGIFSVTAFAVNRRASEIGVRMALGARPSVVVRNNVGDTTVPIAAGLAAGIGASFLASRLVTAFLFQTSANDALTFAAAAIVLAGASLFAAWLPARKAARIDPVSAMRSE